MKVFGASNKTKDRAKAKKLPTGYLDARPDVEAVIDYAFKLNKNKSIILLGSSYSAALSLLIAPHNEKLISLILFSPVAHLKGVQLAKVVSEIKIPVFATSAKREISDVAKVLQKIDNKYVTQYKPTEEGFHGSKILWESVTGYEKVWSTVEDFLKSN